MLNMKHILCFVLYIVFTGYLCTSAEKGIASKQQAEKIMKRCPYVLRKLWQTDISSFPFAATPLVVDIDGDGDLDVVAAPFGEALAVVEGETGKHLHDTSWPQHNLDKSMHSSPMQYDIDGDGILDVMFVTSQGEVVFYSQMGHALHQFGLQIPSAHVKTEWFSDMTHVDYHRISSYVSDISSTSHIAVGPHVLSTPVLHDMRYLILPVSYFNSDDDHDDNTEPGRDTDAKGNIFIAAVVVMDLKEWGKFAADNEAPLKDVFSKNFLKVFFLELSQTPQFNLFSPTVVDVDGHFGTAEIITGLSSGYLYILSLDGKIKSGFPKIFSPISGRVAAADLDKVPGLELIVLDTTGNATCVDGQTGAFKWSVGVGGASFAGSRIVDVDLDGQLDVVIATDEGNVFALNGLTGTILPKYPFRTGRRISGHVLVTKFNAIRGPYDLVFLSDDGILHLLAGDHSCLTQVALADTTFVDILMQNVVPMNRGMELLIATSDGSLVCLGSSRETPPEELVEEEFLLMAHRLASPPSPISLNDFIFDIKKVVIMIDGKTRYLKEVTGSSVDVYYSVHGTERGEKFELRVYMGSQMVHQQTTGESDPAWVTVRTPEQPGQAQVTVVLVDKYGFVSSDSVFLRFNQLILLDLQWLVLAPFIAMVIILLVNHGFPAKDLLPVTFPFKSK